MLQLRHLLWFLFLCLQQRCAGIVTFLARRWQNFSYATPIGWQVPSPCCWSFIVPDSLTAPLVTSESAGGFSWLLDWELAVFFWLRLGEGEHRCCSGLDLLRCGGWIYFVPRADLPFYWSLVVHIYLDHLVIEQQSTVPSMWFFLAAIKKELGGWIIGWLTIVSSLWWLSPPGSTILLLLVTVVVLFFSSKLWFQSAVFELWISSLSVARVPSTLVF